MKLRPGALIAGRFRVERRVGAGGMGEVWAGEQTALGVQVALKTLLPSAARNLQIVARFKREAYLLGRIRSDYVARVVDFINDPDDGLVLVMEFVEGEPLSVALDDHRLTVEETLDLGIDLARGLCDLHRAHIVHRDIKPENIILRPLPDGGRRAMIVDFGVGRMFTADERVEEDEEEITGITHADMAIGTVAYMAPEQILNSRGATGAADIYALGAILYRAAAGQDVFGPLEDAEYARTKLSSPPTRLELPRFDRAASGLQTLVGRALAKNPSGRFKTADAMLKELVALRDLAGNLAADLDGATEAAPISSLLPALIGRQSRPSGVPLEAPTIDEAKGANATPAMPDDAPTTLRPSEALAAMRKQLADALDEEDDVMPTRIAETPVTRAVLETIVTPRASSPSPAPSLRPSRLTIVVALLAGGVLGFLAHWGLTVLRSAH
jgi:serine/threonine-protein kinase